MPRLVSELGLCTVSLKFEEARAFQCSVLVGLAERTARVVGIRLHGTAVLSSGVLWGAAYSNSLSDPAPSFVGTE